MNLFKNKVERGWIPQPKICVPGVLVLCSLDLGQSSDHQCLDGGPEDGVRAMHQGVGQVSARNGVLVSVGRHDDVRSVKLLEDFHRFLLR